MQTQLVCDQCGREFTSPISLRAHKFRAHTQAGKNLTRKLSNKFDNRVKQTGSVQNLSIKDKDLLFEIANTYKNPGGGVAWKRAMREHPEWAKQMGYKPHT